MTCIPTRLGDVLILETTQSFRIHAVGVVTYDGQQDFAIRPRVQYLHDRGMDSAVTMATTMLEIGRRVFLRNLDTGHWSDVTNWLDVTRSTPGARASASAVVVKRQGLQEARVRG